MSDEHVWHLLGKISDAEVRKATAIIRFTNSSVGGLSAAVINPVKSMPFIHHYTRLLRVHLMKKHFVSSPFSTINIYFQFMQIT